MSEKTRSNSGNAGKSIVKTGSDSTLEDLQERYNMDADVWHKSKRGFPFNIPL
jgi:hypothetical protein